MKEDKVTIIEMDVNNVSSSPKTSKPMYNLSTPRRQKMDHENSTCESSPRAFVIESEGISVVPYFKRSPVPRESKKFQWSVNALTNQPTITRKENFANGRWCEVPSSIVPPLPPIAWIQSKPVFDEDEIAMTSTMKKEYSSSLSLSLDESSNDSSSSSESSSSKYSNATSNNDSGYVQ